MLEYANQADIWPDATTAPADAADLTLHANLLVGHATRGALYAVDAEGYPTRTVLRTAFKDAVLQQARFWQANGLRPQDGDVGVESDRAVTSKRIGSAQVDYEDGVSHRAARRDAILGLCATAYYLLENAGLLNGQPRRR